MFSSEAFEDALQATTVDQSLAALQLKSARILGTYM